MAFAHNELATRKSEYYLNKNGIVFWRVTKRETDEIGAREPFKQWIYLINVYKVINEFKKVIAHMNSMINEHSYDITHLTIGLYKVPKLLN